MTAEPERREGWLKLANSGVELAAAVGGLTLLGYWVDRHFALRPWGVLCGALLGLVGGLYNLVRSSLAASREAAREDADHKRSGP